MNIKALIKTVTPSAEFVAAMIGLSFFAIIAIAVCAGVVLGIFYTIAYFFDEKTAGLTLMFGWIIPWTYVIIVEPLIDRYKMIKWEMERE